MKKSVPVDMLKQLKVQPVQDTKHHKIKFGM